MDPLIVLLLLGMLCMVAMPLMMLFGGRRHWMDRFADRTSSMLERGPETAREILDRRYASGEITNVGYQAMLDDLEPPVVPK
jgi:uncharacterized membrane protein